MIETYYFLLESHLAVVMLVMLVVIFRSASFKKVATLDTNFLGSTSVMYIFRQVLQNFEHTSVAEINE